MNFRTLQLGYETRVDSPGDWQPLLLALLTSRRQVLQPRALVRELGKSSLTVEEQITRFARDTGLSRRSFQLYRRELGLARSYARNLSERITDTDETIGEQGVSVTQPEAEEETLSLKSQSNANDEPWVPR